MLIIFALFNLYIYCLTVCPETRSSEFNYQIIRVQRNALYGYNKEVLGKVVIALRSDIAEKIASEDCKEYERALLLMNTIAYQPLQIADSFYRISIMMGVAEIVFNQKSSNFLQFLNSSQQWYPEEWFKVIVSDEKTDVVTKAMAVYYICYYYNFIFPSKKDALEQKLKALYSSLDKECLGDLALKEEANSFFG